MVSPPNTAAAAALTALVGVGCLDVPPQAPAPEQVVADIHAAYVDGDLTSVHAHVDYRFRLAETLGEVWQRAPEEDRARTEALARQMFVETLDRLWNEHVAGRPLMTTVRYASPDVAWVRVEAQVPAGAQTTEGKTPPTFAWRYRLHRRGAQEGQAKWQVTEREYQVSFARSETGKFFPRVIKQLMAQYGRPPTLKEINANLPSLRGRLKKRVFRIPEAAFEGR